ncbi:SEFIR domain-containing protein [Amycolatopsis sp. PS_44_ISF1]|uniref:SEFIR domain-containing protein n=1 Tax=Amycolatopsis sp. PS_44_ISF1 TaxID=2974917 RepID=UPI0028E0585F|nr:SEFIR domain-containing protein [Amycolatopsis sp. PS_44_ISF1]MDT8913394.1 TIR domain-containing protein [Amycolatopsis sp. PS_44_ISF1]
MSGPDDAGAAPRPEVFVSYAEDSPAHASSVREFSAYLREYTGVNVQLDAWADDSRRDWALWVAERLREAKFVLAIASPQYKRVVDSGERFAGRPSIGLGAALMRNSLSRDLSGETMRVLPVILPGRSADDIPDLLCGSSTTSYEITELSLEGVRGLLAVLTGVPRHAEPRLGRPLVPPRLPGAIVVAAPKPPAATAVLSAEAEVVIGSTQYVVHRETLQERPIDDHSALQRHGRALRIGSPHRQVWLRQVEMRHETPGAKAAVSALKDEYELLRSAAGACPGLPGSPGLFHDGPVSTLVTDWPASEQHGGPCPALAAFVPGQGEATDPWEARRSLAAIAGLCRPLAALHLRGLSHRALTPEGIIRRDGGELLLRDLGLATTAFRPGEGPAEYRAPEQRPRGGGRAGPWTDVHQLAAVAYHLVTGHRPQPTGPLPVHALAPDLPPLAAEHLDAALRPEPGRRPSLDALAAAFRGRPPARN